MRRLLRQLITCCGLGLAVAVAAQPMSPQVVVVSSGMAPAYAQASQALIDALERGGLPRRAVALMTADDLAHRDRTGQVGGARVYVGLGVRAMQSLLSVDVHAPVLGALIPRLSFNVILQSTGRQVSDQLSAIYLDQPLRRQMALLHLALPQARQIGVLLGPSSVARLPELRTLAQESGLLVRHAEVVGDQALFPALREVLDDSDVLLALADPLVFSSSTIKNILLSSFRARVPMVAFSPAYARAGALLALYSSPAQVGQQAGAMVLAALRSARLPEQAVEPDDFLVDVNADVARAMGLAPDGAQLRRALRRMEHLP